MTDPAPPNPAPTPSAPSPRPEHLGTIAADRACAHCGFNLFAQPITREPHYALPIARCPECGTVAALQEYPALGPWARRWAAALAGLWMGTLVLASAATVILALTFTVASIDEASQTAAQTLVDHHAQWTASLTPEQQQAVQPGLYAGTSYSRWDRPDPAWPALARPGDALGRKVDIADRDVIWMWCSMVLVVSPFAVFWPLALPQQPPWRTAIPPVVAAAIGATLAYSILRTEAGAGQTFESLASLEMAPLILAATLGILVVTFGVWGLAGRPLARLVIRMALPPQMRVPFAFLWHADAKPLPRPHLPSPP